MDEANDHSYAYVHGDCITMLQHRGRTSTVRCRAVVPRQVRGDAQRPESFVNDKTFKSVLVHWHMKIGVVTIWCFIERPGLEDVPAACTQYVVRTRACLLDGITRTCRRRGLAKERSTVLAKLTGANAVRGRAATAASNALYAYHHFTTF
jgi:hypothetical protein